LRELEYILKFKLSNEDLIETKISNETEDYVDSTFTKRQALTITKVLYKKYDEMIN